ncbi:MAG: hypothetical protein ABIE74_12750 [Pseudomonadota bacterium]
MAIKPTSQNFTPLTTYGAASLTLPVKADTTSLKLDDIENLSLADLLQGSNNPLANKLLGDLNATTSSLPINTDEVPYYTENITVSGCELTLCCHISRVNGDLVVVADLLGSDDLCHDNSDKIEKLPGKFILYSSEYEIVDNSLIFSNVKRYNSARPISGASRALIERTIDFMKINGHLEGVEQIVGGYIQNSTFLHEFTQQSNMAKSGLPTTTKEKRVRIVEMYNWIAERMGLSDERSFSIKITREPSHRAEGEGTTLYEER